MINKSKCDKRDTFSKWHEFCPAPQRLFTLDTSRLASKVVGINYTGMDTFTCIWGDGTITSNSSGVKVYESYGIYTLQIILKTTCGRSDTSRYTFTAGTSGINSINLNAIQISPNPAKDYLLIKFPRSFHFKQEIQLYDVLGRLQPLELLEKGINELKFDVSELPKGIYILRIGDTKHKLQIE